MNHAFVRNASAKNRGPWMALMASLLLACSLLLTSAACEPIPKEPDDHADVSTPPDPHEGGHAATPPATDLAGGHDKTPTPPKPPKPPTPPTPPKPPKRPTPTPPPASAAGKGAGVSMLYSTAISGELFDCGCPGHPRGGLAKKALWIKKFREARKSVAHFDAGNAFFTYRGPAGAADDKAKKSAIAIMRGLLYMGVEAVNVGPQDLKAGLEFLQSEIAPGHEGHALPLVSANLASAADGELLFAPYRVVEVNGVRLGVFGVIDPAVVKDPAVKALPAEEAVSRMVDELADKCDLVVGLYAMNLSNSSRLAKAVAGVDVVVSSEKSGALKTRPVVLGETILVSGGNRGMYLGRMDLTVSFEEKDDMPKAEYAALKEELTRLEAQAKILEGEIARDAAVRAQYDRAIAKQESIKTKLAGAASNFTYDNALISIEADMHDDETVAAWVKETGATPPKKRGH